MVKKVRVSGPPLGFMLMGISLSTDPTLGSSNRIANVLQLFTN